jgi:signal transduction histidine kinase
MAKYKRIKGGEKNEKSGREWIMPELEKVADLYIELDGKGIHENNSKIHQLADDLGRTIRSVENQLLGFRKVATNETGRTNYNRLIPIIWKNKTSKSEKSITAAGFQFRVSSALKDIIGQDLITDDYIAIFELVKNSYDAYASRVDIYFENIYSNEGRIIIKDNGKGMDADDLKNKWLFVAYSAKKEGTEDKNYDYRNNIYSKRAFAGAKGIGRFSCDKLGRILYLETIKRSPRSKVEVLVTDWGKFEEDSTEEFVDIGVEHYQEKQSSYNLKYGTALEISELRSEWNREKLQKLKSSLAKLINPNQGRSEQKFKIFIHAEEEKEKDRLEKDEKDRVNGEVKNFIFEELGLKTTKIFSSLSSDGKYLNTELLDGGTLIYRITERNEYELLDNINVTIYYLNKAAKIIFTNRMGVSSIEYGHIFLYKNGFRIYPYGEPGEDPLGIDARKTQGVRRYFGTRELIGQIEIFSDSDQLKETSSRGDGLRKTETYYQLMEFFWNCLRRLERYTVDVQKWGLSIEDNMDKDMNERIANFISNVSNSNSIIEFEYPKNLIEILQNAQSKSAFRVIQNLRKIGSESNNNRLLKEVDEAEKKLRDIQLAREEAEKEAEEQRKKAEAARKELEQKNSQILFLKSVKSQDLDDVVSFLHHIGISSKVIDTDLKLSIKRLQRGGSITSKDYIDLLERVSFENKKILSISKFASKANFQLYVENIQADLVVYLREYINNILGLSPNQKPLIHYSQKPNFEFITSFKPIEFNIIVDNLISNSRRAKAEDIYINVDGNKKILTITFADNGKGIAKENQDKIFGFGFTTTSGSGIGLFHVKKILLEMNGNIELSKTSNLTEFIITLKK